MFHLRRRVSIITNNWFDKKEIGRNIRDCIIENRNLFIDVQVKRKSFNSTWMTKGLAKSSKKKQRLHDNFWRVETLKRNWIINQYKTLFKSLKKKSKKNYYSELVDSYKYKIKKAQDVMKEITGNKRVANAALPNFITMKNRDIWQKRN